MNYWARRTRSMTFIYHKPTCLSWIHPVISGTLYEIKPSNPPTHIFHLKWTFAW